MKGERLRDLLKFSRPKGPGFGIREDFYLTVLCARAPLPAPLVVANPKGEGGAAVGFIAPLGAGAGPEALTQPLARGRYAVTTRDRKNVLELTVVPCAESGYDPEAFLRSAAALDVSPETAARIRGAWTLAQLRFRAHDPAVFPAMAFAFAIARRLGETTDGVVADPMALRYLPWERVPRHRSDAPPAAADHVGVSPGRAGTAAEGRVVTAGMSKFDLPELVLRGIPEAGLAEASSRLLAFAETVLRRGPLDAGDRLRDAAGEWTVTPAADPDLPDAWELLPPTGR